MMLLVYALALFALAHFAKSMGWPMRDAIIARIGKKAWMALIALILIGSVWLMVQGYREAYAEALWVVPAALKGATVVLMLPVLVLYMGSYPGSAIRSHVRHPQLTGFSLWAGLHLVVNGEARSTVLFGGLLLWTLLTMVMLNRRDGTPPLPVPHASTLRAWAAVPIGAVTWVVLLLAHPWLFGVNPLG